MQITEELLSGVALLSVHIRELLFLDNPEETGRAKRPTTDINIEFETSVSADGLDGRARIRVTITPHKPSVAFREIVASVEGHFRAVEGAAAMPMAEFLDKQGAVILMPFARDAVVTATQKSRFGAFLLQPINVAAMLQRLERETRPDKTESTSG
jgi:preprotein translocase subunit SecB